MWTCLTCNAENEDTTDICINCNLEKSLSEQIQIKLSKQKKRARIIIPIINTVGSLNALYLLIYYFIFYNKLPFPSIYLACTIIYIASLIGLWQYKKWGIYLFVVFIISNIILTMFGFSILFSTLSGLISIVLLLNYKRYFT